jgi:hypothetical protein
MDKDLNLRFVTVKLEATYTVEVFSSDEEEAIREACSKRIPVESLSDIEKHVLKFVVVSYPKSKRVSILCKNVPHSLKDAPG